MKVATIFCDGSSVGNPGPGGWGAVVVTQRDGKGNEVLELGASSTETTNNRMELTAAIESLKHVPDDTSVTVKTDSQYVINGITKWVFGWERNGWQTKEKKDVLNKDLWQELAHEVRVHTVEWEHVRGHAGVALNERVDQIANGFARREEVKLFKGTEEEHTEFLKGMPKARVVASGSKNKGPAYSYVSVVDGKVRVHKTWAECEACVKGKKAKFKKVFSKEEEEILISEWSA